MKVLIAGAYGQVGQELIRAISAKIGIQNVICADLREPPSNVKVAIHEKLDILNKQELYRIIQKHKPSQMYSLAALLSASGEVDPLKTQHINMTSLFNSLEAAREGKVKKLFWPSSIAAFGSNTPKKTPQVTIMEPSTIYGITKKAGQLWCDYYFRRYGVDVRSLRYPGLIGWRSPPGGGTTDYAVDIFHKAVLGKKFTCYLKEDSKLPMIYTDDAIDATLQLMQAPKENLTIRTSYNIQGFSFTPKEIGAQIKKNIPSFEMDYKIDPLRQGIANSWPFELEDQPSRLDWQWKPKYDLQKTTKQILKNLTPQLVKQMNS